MSRLVSSKRAKLPASAFAYIDSRGRRRLPIHDEAHVRNALARFSQVGFEDDAARERARTRLLNAAKKYRIMPVGFITGQLQSERSNATAGRLVIELQRVTDSAVVLKTDSAVINSRRVRLMAESAIQFSSAGQRRDCFTRQVERVTELEHVRIAQLVGVNAELGMIFCEPMNDAREAARWTVGISEARYR